MGEEQGTPASSRPGSSAARSRDAAKKRAALWKKQARSFKLKDVDKKVDAVRFCVQDERFFREQPDVLPLLMGFLTRVKTPELVMETLSAMQTLLSPQAPAEAAVVDPNEATAEAIHPEVNAEFILERSMEADSTWKAGEPFVALFVASALAPEIRIKAIEVYDLLLQASVAQSAAAGAATAVLLQFQSVGSPCSALLGCLDGDSGELQYTALSCLRRLLQNPPSEEFLAAFEAEKGLARALQFVSHSERRFHRPALDILASYSHFECGRVHLKQNGAPGVLCGALQEAQQTMQATSASVLSGGMGASPLSADAAPLLCSNIAVICEVFVRVSFAKEQVKASNGSEETDVLASTVVDAMVAILQYDIENALAAPVGPPTESPRQTGGAAAAAAAAAANAAALASLIPFSSDRSVAMVASLGRVVEHSEKCKMQAKARGVLPVLLDCFKVKHDEKLHQVADKLLHLCICINNSSEPNCQVDQQQQDGEGEGGETSQAKQHVRIDPQILCAVATGDSNPLGPAETTASEPKTFSSIGEKPPLVAVEALLSLLEASHSAGNKALVFRHIRWIATLVDLPGNANALGERAVAIMLRILAETLPDETLHFAFLAKCVHAIVLQNADALELCGNDHHDPSASFFLFLERISPVLDAPSADISLPEEGETAQEAEFPSAEEPTATEGPADEVKDSDEPVSSLCKLEWIDEYDEAAAFTPNPLTEARHDVDPFLCIAQALAGLASAFLKWNPTTEGPIATNFRDLIANKLELEHGGAPGKAGTVSAAAGSKKKLPGDAAKSPVVGETVMLCILERGMQVSKLLPHLAAINAAVCVALLELLNTLMTIPGGLQTLLHLAKTELDAEGAANASLAPSEFEQHATWPIPADQCSRMEHTRLLVPVLNVLQSPDTSFIEIEAAVRSIAVMTSDLEPIEKNPFAATSESTLESAKSPAKGGVAVVAVPPASTIPEIVITESDRFVNVALGCGALVLLMSFMDKIRIPIDDDDDVSSDRLALMELQIEGLVLQFVTLAQLKQEHALAKHREKMGLEQGQATPSTDPDAPIEVAADLELPYQGQWARLLLDCSFGVARFGYSSYSALLLASELALTDVVTALLGAGASTATTSSEGVTPLMTAFLIGNEAMISELLAAQSDVNAITTDGHDLSVWNCALVAPVGMPVSDMITKAYATAHNSKIGPTMRSHVQLDAILGSPRLLDSCLRSGMDVNVSNAHGEFLLHSLLSKSLVRRRLRGLNLCFRYNSNGDEASAADLLMMVTTLIERHTADVNSCNLVGQTPLHLALMYGHTEIVKLLLSHGANPNVRDKLGHLPIHYACLGFCGNADERDDTAVEVVRLLLQQAEKFDLKLGIHSDLRKHKSPEEKQALVIATVLDEGLQSVLMPPAIAVKLSSAQQVLTSPSFSAGFLPWHFLCGASSQLTASLCLDDDMEQRLEANGQVRARLLRYLTKEWGVDISTRASNGMTALHLATKSDVNGSNLDVLNVLLEHRGISTAATRSALDVNAVHEHMLIDSLPVIPDGAGVTVVDSGRYAMRAYVSSRSLDGKYHVILANGEHRSGIERGRLQVTSDPSGTHSRSYKYLLLMESAFSALHYALQANDDTLALRLLALPEISLEPETSDLPLLVLACAARQSPEVVQRLITQQANMRVHLPLRSTNCDLMAVDASTTSSLANRKHAAALHYAVMHEDVAVATVLVSNPEGHVNVNVRRSGDGFTPLHLACEMLNMKIVKLLIDHGANLVQLSTSAAGGIAPLQLLMKYDSMENEKLKELIDEKYATADMLLEELEGNFTPRESRINEEQHESNQASGRGTGVDSQLKTSGSRDDEDDKSEQSLCILLDAEDRNLELFERVQSFHLSRKTGQEAFIRRLEADLERSDDVLRAFFELFKQPSEPHDAVQDPEGSAVKQRSSEAPHTVAFRNLQHRHECFRQHTVRSQWKSKASTAKMVRVGSSGEPAS